MAGDVGGRLQPALPALGLLEKTCVLDGDTSACGECLHELLVFRGETRRVLFVRQVEIAEDLGSDTDRNAEETVHGRVPGWEAVRPAIGGDVVEPQWVGFADEQAEDALATRKITNPANHALVEADMDELLEVLVVGDHAECSVAGIDEITGRFDNAGEHDGQAQVGGNHAACAQQTA